MNGVLLCIVLTMTYTSSVSAHYTHESLSQLPDKTLKIPLFRETLIMRQNKPSFRYPGEYHNMTDDKEKFLETMLGLGLTAYEAQVYFVLFQLKYATVHDIHSACTVPRNKIYETLASLEEKGFAAVIDTNPLRYARIDIERVFVNLRRAEMDKLNRSEAFLKSQEAEQVFDLESVAPHAYELHSQMAIESHLKAMIRNTRKELIIGVSDAEFFNSLFTRQELRKIGKRADLYIVVRDPALKDRIEYPCYVFEEENISKHMEGFEDQGRSIDMSRHMGKIALISDRKNMLNIDMVDDKPIASVMLTRFPFVLSLLFSNLEQYLIPLK